MGITSQLTGNPAEVIGGLRTAARCSRWPTPTRRSPTAARTCRPTIIDKVVFPDGSVRQPRRPAAHPRVHRRRGLRGDQVLKTVITERNRHRGQLRLPGRGQDRYRGEPRQRLVRRLHAADLDRRLGRVPAGQHPDVRRLRRHAGGADLARLHGQAARTGTAATSPSPPSRSPERRSRGRTRPHASRLPPAPPGQTGPGTYTNPTSTPSRLSRARRPPRPRPVGQRRRPLPAARRAPVVAGGGAGGGGGGHHQPPLAA